MIVVDSITVPESMQFNHIFQRLAPRFLLRATRTPTSTRHFQFGGSFYMLIPTGSWVLVIIYKEV